jgi:hypothetical protein
MVEHKSRSFRIYRAFLSEIGVDINRTFIVDEE